MRAEGDFYLRLALSLVVLCHFVNAAPVVSAQQAKIDYRGAAKNACTDSERARFTVKCKDRYYLGETPTITISITNTGRSPLSVKEAEYQKFALEMTGLFGNDSGQDKKAIVWDGSWDIPKQTKQPKPGELILWKAPTKREPKYLTLAPNESTNLTLELPRIFNSPLGVSKYKLTVKSEDGQTVVKEFEVYFDNEKSFPILAKMLESDDQGERNQALLNLVQFNRTKLKGLAEEWLKSGNEKQREFGSEVLTKIRTGWFDALKIKVEGKERFAVSENPTIAISIQNGTSTPKTVRDAQQQKFLLELKRVLPNDSKQESKTCVYAPKDSQQKPKLVTLGEFDSTTLILNLSECFGARLDAGKYELIVKSADQEEIKDQTVIRKFEVF